MRQILYQFFKLLYAMTYRIAINVLPINNKVILFESSVGRNYSGNPKYIYEELVRQKLDQDYKCIWVLESSQISVPGNCSKIKRNGIRHLYYAAVSRFWVFDSRQTDIFLKRKGSVFIQTWHGTPLKKLALDMTVLNMGGHTDLGNYQDRFLLSVKSWDYLISQNSYSTAIFKRAFDFQKEIWEVGYPRNDILVNDNTTQRIEELKVRLGIPMDKKIILYAPTWRDDEYYSSGKWKINLHLDLKKLHSELNDKYFLLIKTHYLVTDIFNESSSFFRAFTHEQDIQELYLISDILITDYSSVMFDFCLLRRPIIFYVYDYERYKSKLRGFYFDLYNEAPGPLVSDQDQLVTALNDYNMEQYSTAYEKFVRKFNHTEDGKAAFQVVEKIKGLSKRIRE